MVRRKGMAEATQGKVEQMDVHAQNGSNMLIDERRQHILTLIQRNGRVLISQVSAALGISRITIRKDIDYLASKGLVRRSHGGAISTHGAALLDPSLGEKEQKQLREKERIAAAAAALVVEGMCVVLDSGTTTSAIARELRRFSRLTVITNAVNIATALAATDFEVILTGGSLRKNSFSLVGPLAEDALREIHADILFLGVDGFDVKTGVMTPNLLESRVNRSMIHAAERVVAVCDSTKFSRRSLALIAPPSAIQTVITDDQLGSEEFEALTAAGIEVMRV
ncbi:MAG TPA: DeoR/GlpR family DNA-binding transcription regulator [Terriglobales bacterium]|nr:DeoR/GlpR family DNA-binding transcription regulator [Terriglobales bacterium]